LQCLKCKKKMRICLGSISQPEDYKPTPLTTALLQSVLIIMPHFKYKHTKLLIISRTSYKHEY